MTSKNNNNNVLIRGNRLSTLRLKSHIIFANQLREFKETISDEGPPFKKLGWMNDKGKSTKDNLNTMIDAKVAIKWLLDQAVSHKADNETMRAENTDLQENVQGDHDNQSENIAS
ncbi:hypothetical protein DPMN_038073 [Dreissena polymorpha]|uniref:Uncharacterized protein n=1 Tax=Dreissena polymorpha TaxID=45954 RepID=A0A9D4MCG4_DREPO|nr:hypothetical protein DPMN_038073 [Dreissena polymorpha]